MRLILSLYVIIAFSPVKATAQALPDSLWQQGTRAVAAEEFQVAVQSFERILSQGYEHEYLYYNLGNAYYRLGKTGLAIWSYEKGLQLDPGLTDLNFNLEVARLKIKDRIDLPPGFFLLDIYRSFKHNNSTEGLLLWAGFLLLISGGAFFARKLYWPDKQLLRLVTTMAIFLSIILHLISVDIYLELSEKQEGIIIKTVTEAHSTPSGLGKTLFRVHEGLKVEIFQIQDDWLEINLLDGKKGWVYSGALRLL